MIIDGNDPLMVVLYGKNLPHVNPFSLNLITKPCLEK